MRERANTPMRQCACSRYTDEDPLPPRQLLDVDRLQEPARDRPLLIPEDAGLEEGPRLGPAERPARERGLLRRAGRRPRDA